MSGKGSAPRPFSVDAETFADNWQRIFGAKSEDSPLEENKDGEAAEVQQS